MDSFAPANNSSYRCGKHTCHNVVLSEHRPFFSRKVLASLLESSFIFNETLGGNPRPCLFAYVHVVCIPGILAQETAHVFLLINMFHSSFPRSFTAILTSSTFTDRNSSQQKMTFLGIKGLAPSPWVPPLWVRGSPIRARDSTPTLFGA